VINNASLGEERPISIVLNFANSIDEWNRKCAAFVSAEHDLSQTIILNFPPRPFNSVSLLIVACVNCGLKHLFQVEGTRMQTSKDCFLLFLIHKLFCRIQIEHFHCITQGNGVFSFTFWSTERTELHSSRTHCMLKAFKIQCF
jgi:hypothetical protein